MPRKLPDLRTGRYLTESELAAHALRAVNSVVGIDDNGNARRYRSRRELADALGVTPSAMSAALALADPNRQRTEYDRGQKVRRLILRKLLGYAVADEPAWSVKPAPKGERLA